MLTFYQILSENTSVYYKNVMSNIVIIGINLVEFCWKILYNLNLETYIPSHYVNLIISLRDLRIFVKISERKSAM